MGSSRKSTFGSETSARADLESPPLPAAIARDGAVEELAEPEGLG
jgi:hypothetical protein